MKKLTLSRIIAVAGLLTTSNANAQFNKVYSYYFTGQPTRSNVLDLTAADYGTHTALIRTDSLYNNARQTHIALKKTNYAGSTLFDRVFESRSEDYRLEPWRTVLTPDSGYIVVGRAIDLNYHPPAGMVKSDPFAIKFDEAGNLVWSYLYPTNAVAFRDEEPTVVTRVVDDSADEGYIIVRAGSPTNGGYANDASINALRIDGSGMLVWNKRFSDVNRLSSGDSMLRDLPTALVFVQNGGYYFIAGTRQRVAGQGYGDTTICMIGLDRAGQVVRGYRTLRVLTRPSGVDALYDPQVFQNAVVLSFVQENNRIADSNGVFNRSQVGLIRMLANLGSVQYMRSYWQADSVINYRGTRIKMAGNNKEYLVSTDAFAGSFNFEWQASLLKVTRAGSSVFWKRYNIRRMGENHALLVHYGGPFSTEWNVLGGATNSLSSTYTDSRLIEANNSGIACGARSYQVRDTSRSDSMRYYSYKGVDAEQVMDLELREIHYDIHEQDCDTANPNYGKYALAGIEATSPSNDLQVFPTLLESGMNTLTVQASLAKGDALYATLYSIDGKKQQGNEWTLASDSVTQLRIETTSLSTGLYYLVIKTRSGSLRRTFRVVKQ